MEEAPGEPIAGKAAAFVTRRVRGELQLLVFDHAGMAQLPAGTLHPREDPAAGAVREAWEETGVPGLEVVAELGRLPALRGAWTGAAVLVAAAPGCPVATGYAVTVLEESGAAATIHSDFYGWTGEVPAACISRRVDRYLFHLRTTTPLPDEWWVITPDGRGNEWPCRWVPLDGNEPLGDWQQGWLDEIRTSLLSSAGAGRDRTVDDEVAPPFPDAADGPSHEEFYAPPWSGQRFLVTQFDTPPPAGARLGSAIAVCIAEGGDAVVVAGDPELGWATPGGHIEAGETPDEAVRREVMEEACARVVDLEPLGSVRIDRVTPDRQLVDRHWSVRYWARVELDEWAPRFETAHRRLVPATQLLGDLRWRTPAHVSLVEAALVVERGRATPSV